MHIIVKYENEEAGRVFTNRSLSQEEILRLAGIDLAEQEAGIPKWDIERFEFEPLSDSEYAARLLGSTTSDKKAAAARINGRSGGRPRKKKIEGRK